MNQEHNPYQSPNSEVTSKDMELGEAKLAGRGARFAGAFIDGVIMLAILAPIQWMAGMYEDFPNVPYQGLGDTLMWSAVGFGVMLLLNGYLLATRAQSIGKVLVGTKIVTLEGENADFGRIVIRRMLPMSIAALIPIAGSFVGLADALFIFGKERRCIHDHIASTRVVVA